MNRMKSLLSAAAAICCLGLWNGCEKNPVGNNTTTPGATAYGFFVVTHPTAGDSLTVGTYDSIVWTPIPGAITGSYVSLRLYNESTYVSTIDASEYNDGIFYWTVPSTLASGDRYHIRISGTSDTNQYDFGGYFTIVGIDPDAYEFDNTRDSARTAVSGALQQRSLTYGDTDWVRIPMDSGRTYIIQDSGVSSFYTRLYLYYESETSYRSYDYSTSTLTWQYACTETGTYYLKIYPYYSGYTGSYTLRVTEFDPYSSVAFSSPDSNTTWAAGSNYTISWTPDAGLFSSYIRLYLYNGASLVYSIDTYDPNDGTYSFTLPSGLATGTDYRIRLQNYSTSAVYGYSQAFTISGVNADAYEYDDERDSAKTALSGIAQLHTMTYGDYDWVRFAADSGSTYVLQVTTGPYTSYPTRVYFYLYYDTETSSTYSTYSSSSGILNYVWSCTRSGTWYVRMYPYSTTYLGEYSFRATKIDSTLVTFANPTSSSVWDAGTAYTINWSADTGIFSGYIRLYLYKGNSSVYSIDTYDPNDGSYSFTVPAGLATGSDYRIRIANYSYSSIYAYSPAFSISGIAPDSYEYDDTAGAAKSITTDGVAQGRTLTRGDYDWISFTAERDSMYVLQANGGSAVYMYLYLYSSPTTSVTYTSGYTPKIAWTCPAAGTYYLRVSQYSTSYYGSYTASVRKYSPMSSVVFANPTAGAAWTTGSAYTINWSADTSLFGSYVNLQLAVDTAVLSTIVTYRANTQGGSTYSWTPPAGLATGNRYRIKVVNYSTQTIAGFSDTFTISGIAPDPFEPDNSSATAHTIATDGTAEGHTITLGDRDWYSFSATGNLLYVLESHGQIRPATYLYNTDGTTLLTSANTSYTDTAATIVWMCPATGTYFFRDTATGSYGYGSYQASVTVYDSAAYSLTVTAPAANDSLTTGQTYAVQWSSAISIGGNVDIFLYNGAGIVGTVVANIANSGSYSWTVAGTIPSGSDYYVRVISRTYSSISGNSGVFKIGAP